LAKTSSVTKNLKRQNLVIKYAEKRRALTEIAKDGKASQEERNAARQELGKLPRNSSPFRVRNRCVVTGRPRGYIRYFGLSRIAFREMAHKGHLPGVKKASW